MIGVIAIFPKFFSSVEVPERTTPKRLRLWDLGYRKGSVMEIGGCFTSLKTWRTHYKYHAEAPELIQVEVFLCNKQVRMIDEIVKIMWDPLELRKYTQYKTWSVIAPTLKLEGCATDNVQIRGLSCWLSHCYTFSSAYKSSSQSAPRFYAGADWELLYRGPSICQQSPLLPSVVFWEFRFRFQISILPFFQKKCFLPTNLSYSMIIHCGGNCLW